MLGGYLALYETPEIIEKVNNALINQGKESKLFIIYNLIIQNIMKNNQNTSLANLNLSSFLPNLQFSMQIKYKKSSYIQTFIECIYS